VAWASVLSPEGSAGSVRPAAGVRTLAGMSEGRSTATQAMLLHRQGRSWAEIARFVGQRKLSLTADTYTHVLVDDAELDYASLLAS
jgi:hypothetical protein